MTKQTSTTKSPREKARAAYWRERNEWGERRAAALKAAEAAPDLDTMMPLARDYWLARADDDEFRDRTSPWVRVYRVRANSESYLRVWCIHRLIDRLKKEADDASGLTPAEWKVIEERQMAETAAFMVAINAMIRQAVPR